MTTSIGTTINVYFDSSHNVQYSPNNQIQVPADTVETVIWKGIPPLQFKNTGATVTGLSNITSDKIVFSPGQSFTAGNTDTVTMTINNAGGPSNVSAKVDLGIVDTMSTAQPPIVIDGGGAIRNKGTSILVWELGVVMVAALLAGLLASRAIGGKPQAGPLVGALVATAFCVGAAWMMFRQLG